jgi:hypothetical protein
VPVLRGAAVLALAALLFLAAGLRLAGALRLAAAFRAAGFFAFDVDFAVAALPPSSPDHFPDITRCAASATASAINAPSLLALAMTLVAACDAESAASKPASRIARRALGLALIAAAAAAKPAPSISRLIAALAILSTVDLADPDFDDFFFVLGFAIAKPPFIKRKTLQPRNSSERGCRSMLSEHEMADK